MALFLEGHGRGHSFTVAVMWVCHLICKSSELISARKMAEKYDKHSTNHAVSACTFFFPQNKEKV